MGAFIVNFNVRTDRRTTVEEALRTLGTEAAWVTEPKNGWVTAYEEQASTQDDEHIRRLAAGLSRRSNAATIAFLVHDSDVVCYWLYEHGDLIDEYNSAPSYFSDQDEDGEPSGGNPTALARYCAPDKSLADVEKALAHHERLFAEEQLGEIAAALGIDGTCVNMDYETIRRDADPAELQAVYVGTKPAPEPARRGRRTPAPEQGALESALGKLARAPRDVSAQLLQALGMGGSQPAADPQVQALVDAAAANDVAAIERLAGAGADLNGQANMKAPTLNVPMAARLLGGAIAVPVTPLLAAISHKHVEATRRLLELGADANIASSMFGPAVHLATLSGRLDLLRLVLDAGGDLTATNRQGQTPLAALAHYRTVATQIASSVANLGPLAAALGGRLGEHMKQMLPADEALDQCEALLRERGAK